MIHLQYLIRVSIPRMTPERAKVSKYTLLLNGGLVNGYPWRICVIINTAHPASSNKLGSPYNQQSRGRWYTWVWIASPPRTLQGVTTLPTPKSAVPDNAKVGNQVLCPHSRCFGSYFDVIFFMYLVSSGFSFKSTSSSSIIIIDPF